MRLNTVATEKLLEAGGYDAIIAACGSTPKKLDILGADSKFVLSPIDIFGREDKLGRKIVLIGGSFTGAETAAYLHEIGKDVTVITRQKRICDDFESHEERVFRELIDVIPVITQTQVKAIEENTVVYTDADDREQRISGDTIVMSAGVQANVDECMKFAALAPQFFVVGDSDVRFNELFIVHFVGPEGLNGGKMMVYEPNVRHATFSAYTAAAQI